MRHAKFTKPLTIALSPEVYKVLKERSDTERISMAECVREILAEMAAPHLNTDEKQDKREEKSNDNSK